MTSRLCIACRWTCLAWWAIAVLPVQAGEWPQFRGPGGQGHAVAEGLPLTWSENKNVRWKVPVAGLGWSSPVIQDDQVWITTATDEGRSLRAICLSRDSGSMVHDVEVFHKDDPGPIHKKNSHASPTPILDGDRIFVHFGRHGTACLNRQGRVLWRNEELRYDHRHGPGGSPVLHDGKLIGSCDGTDVQFVVALDAATGKIAWKTERHGRMAYCTPLVLTVDGRPQVVSPGGDQTIAYDPANGQEIWRAKHEGYSVVPRPVTGHGLVYYSSSYDTPTFFAVRLGGSGDVTDSHVAWTLKRGAPHNPSPLLIGDELYLVSDKGIATCLDARTGEQHWQERVGGNFSASPLFADGRIYLLDEDGLTTVIAPGRKFERLAQNQIEGRTLASLGVAGRALFLRSDTNLYRLETP